MVVIMDDIIADAIKEFEEGPEQSGWWLEGDKLKYDDEKEIQGDLEGLDGSLDSEA